MSTKPVERIGLLFVHGIGEQKRFEHLRDTVGELAELMRQTGASDTVWTSVVDRTTDWKPAPGEPHPNGLSPVTLTVENANRRTIFECHEVWWADLGARDGLGDAITFWLWGLGQWCAPIYRELDAAGLSKTMQTGGKALNKAASTLVKLPTSVAGRPPVEFLARLRLALAGLAALLVAVTWLVAKRLLSKIAGQTPSPVLLVQYVGDVRTYEERGVPGDTALSDPGFPRRVGIRRRMVTEMVAMGARAFDGELDGWHVVAHSLGTVLAYNGLTEIGHALPNYLPEAQWAGLPAGLRHDLHCCRRPPAEIGAMMPARPGWLDPDDVLNRPALFAKLRGFVTYGSPLNKFAGIWPRIVATATDRDPPADIFAGCKWFNLRAPQDPVAGNLDSYRDSENSLLHGHIPKLIDIPTPYGLDYVLAHIRYFAGAESFATADGAKQRRAVAGWLFDGPDPAPVAHPLRGWRKVLATDGVYVLVILALLLAAAVLVTLLGGVVATITGADKLVFAGWESFGCALLETGRWTTAAALAAICWGGLRRWSVESLLNLKLADEAAKADPSLPGYWQKQQEMHARHHRAATAVSWVALLALGLEVIELWTWPAWMAAAMIATFVVTIVAASVCQSLVNVTVQPLALKAASGEPAPPPSANPNSI